MSDTYSKMRVSLDHRSEAVLQLNLSQEDDFSEEVYKSDEYDYDTPDLNIQIRLSCLIKALQVLGDYPDDFEAIDIGCEVWSEGFKGKLRGGKLHLMAFPNNLHKEFSWTYGFWVQWRNDWSGTIYEFAIDSYLEQLLGKLSPTPHLLAEKLSALQKNNHTLWIGGIEKAVHLSKVEAINLAGQYKEDGYDDVVIEVDVTQVI